MQAGAGLLNSAVSLAVGIAPTAGMQAAVGAISIDRQDLGAALLAFSRQTGRLILFSPALVRGKIGNAVSSERNPNRALAAILRNSGLMFRATSGGGYLIVPDPAYKAPGPRVGPASRPAGQKPQALPVVRDAENDREIVVTGFLQSVATAIEAKRGASGVTDVIKAEDIAEFPDNNLAESIQRVPGVSISRVAGEGRGISVRGLGPSFTRVRINGIEAQASSGASDASGGANLSRGFDFNVFGSELFNAVTVRKTQDAQTDEGSLGATVDLQTVRPFDYKEPVATVSAETQFNDLRGRFDPRGAALVSTKFANGSLGVLAAATYTQAHRFEEGYGFGAGSDLVSTNGGFCAPIGLAPVNPPLSATTGTTATACSTGVARPEGSASNIAAYLTASGADVHGPRLPRYGRVDYFQRRLGLLGAVQWRPSSSTLISLDILYSRFEEDREEQFLDGFSFSRALSNNGKPQTAVLDAVVSSAGDLIYGRFDNVDMRAENRWVEHQTTFQQYALNIQQDAGEDWHFDGTFGVTSSTFTNPIDATVTNDRVNSPGYIFDARENRRLPILSYNYDVHDAGAYTFSSGVSEIRARKFFVNNDIVAARLNAEYRMAPGVLLKFGGSFKQFDFDSTRFMRNASDLTVPALPPGTTLASLSKSVTDFGRGLDLRAPTPTSFVVPDVRKYVDRFGVYSGEGMFLLGSVDNTSARGGVRGVSEQTRAYYVQIDFRAETPSFTLRGNAGLRRTRTEQQSRGYQVVAGTPVLVIADHDYARWLPALNLTAELPSNVFLRFGAAKVLARPEIGNLTPGGSIQLSGERALTLGNPRLDPVQATTLDVSAEWYFGHASLFSISYFHKNISTFVQSLQRQVPFNELGLPDSLLAGSLTLPTDIFRVSQPVNTPGGPLNGMEASLQWMMPLGFLPEKLNHFGVLANYTRVISKITYLLDAAGATKLITDLTGLSKNAANGTLYFDDGRISVRGSIAYRSAYLTSVPGTGTGNNVNGTQSITTIDFSASLKLLENLKIKIEGLNLTDEFVDQYNDSNRLSANSYTHTGRQINIGFLHKF